MWIAYRDAYQNKKAEQQADIHIEELDARILLIAGTGDEAWPVVRSNHCNVNAFSSASLISSSAQSK